MATTTNFGWTTPDDTDLVKDGAAAIRTLGSGIDTSLVDLKGGTTGQVLSKASNTDLDYSWTTPNVGDITEVQAGTGISIADGTGPIPVITNTVATEFDAKGDLIVGTGADTFDRLAVGTNGYNLVSDSSTSTGLAWAAPASSSGPTFRAYRGANKTISTGTWVKVDYDTEEWDSDSCFNSSTNEFTPNKAGYYQFNYMVNFAGTANNIVLYKNGTRYSGGHFGDEDGWKNGSCLVYLNGTTDYVAIYVYTNNSTYYGGSDQTSFDGIWIRS